MLAPKSGPMLRVPGQQFTRPSAKLKSKSGMSVASRLTRQGHDGQGLERVVSVQDDIAFSLHHKRSFNYV